MGIQICVQIRRNELMKIKAGQVVKVKDIGQLARVVETVGRNAVLDFYFPEGILREKVPMILIDCVMEEAAV